VEKFYGGSTMSIDIDEAKVERNETALWLSWTLATIAGMLVGFVPLLLLVPVLDLGLARLIMPLWAGFLVGIFQWLVLRNYLTHCADWILNGGAGWAVGYALGLMVIQFFSGSIWGAVVGYILFGTIVALIQWPVLRREIRNALPWVAASIAGWGLGAVLSQFVLALLSGGEPLPQVVSTGVIALITGLTAGAITGAVLVWLVRRPDTAI
jgi:hypothetical protein